MVMGSRPKEAPAMAGTLAGMLADGMLADGMLADGMTDGMLGIKPAVAGIWNRVGGLWHHLAKKNESK